MSERSPRPATNDSIGWNTTPTNPSTDPGGAVRAAGWPTDAIPGSDEFNFLQSMWGDNALWIESFVPREWTELSDGIEASTALRQLFRVVPASVVMSQRLAESFSVAGTATGGLNPQSICADGGQVYYVAGTGNEYIVAADPADGSEIWEVQPATGAGRDITAMAVSGFYIFYVHSATPTGLRRRLMDGTAETSGGVTVGHSKLATNGVQVAGIRTGGNLDIWTSAPALVATKTPSSALVAVAIDEDQIYVGGTRNTSDIWCYPVSGGPMTWQVTLDANAPNIIAIAADGDMVYVLTDSFAIAAGGKKMLFCLSRSDGRLLWSEDVGGGNAGALAVDSDYLYVVDSTSACYMVDKRAVGAPILRAPKSNVTSGSGPGAQIAVDGESLYCQDGATATNLRRLTVGGAARTYMLVSGTDPRRRPFHTRAIPV